MFAYLIDVCTTVFYIFDALYEVWVSVPADCFLLSSWIIKYGYYLSSTPSSFSVHALFFIS